MAASTPRRLKWTTGIGERTAQYLALRALRHPDVFPAVDVALQNAAAKLAGRKPGAAESWARAAAWQSRRSYAAQHL